MRTVTTGTTPITPLAAASTPAVVSAAAPGPGPIGWNDFVRAGGTKPVPGSAYSEKFSQGMADARKAFGGLFGRFTLGTTTSERVLEAAEQVPLANVTFETPDGAITKPVHSPKQGSSALVLDGYNAGAGATQLYRSLEEAIDMARALPKIPRSPGRLGRLPAVGVVEVQQGVFALELLSLQRPSDKKSMFGKTVYSPRWTWILDPDPPIQQAADGARLGAALAVSRVDPALRAIVGRPLAEEPAVMLDLSASAAYKRDARGDWQAATAAKQSAK